MSIPIWEEPFRGLKTCMTRFLGSLRWMGGCYPAMSVPPVRLGGCGPCNELYIGGSWLNNAIKVFTCCSFAAETWNRLKILAFALLYIYLLIRSCIYNFLIPHTERLKTCHQGPSSPILSTARHVCCCSSSDNTANRSFAAAPARAALSMEVARCSCVVLTGHMYVRGVFGTNQQPQHVHYFTPITPRRRQHMRSHKRCKCVPACQTCPTARAVPPPPSPASGSGLVVGKEGDGGKDASTIKCDQSFDYLIDRRITPSSDLSFNRAIPRSLGLIHLLNRSTTLPTLPSSPHLSRQRPKAQRRRPVQEVAAMPQPASTPVLPSFHSRSLLRSWSRALVSKPR